MQLCSKPVGARTIDPETFRRRSQLLSSDYWTEVCYKKKEIGHHARPRRASATAPLRTGALHGDGRISPATPRNQNNGQPSRGQPQEALQ